jgi:hypothetical protein
VAPPQQLGGVIMGRLVHCQETCSHIQGLQRVRGHGLPECLMARYSRWLVQSVWSRFLFQRWHSTDTSGLRSLEFGSARCGATLPKPWANTGQSHHNPLLTWNLPRTAGSYNILECLQQPQQECRELSQELPAEKSQGSRYCSHRCPPRRRFPWI